MTSYALSATEVAAYNKTLTASTVDTVTFDRHCTSVRVYKEDAGTGEIYFTIDGSTPTVGGAGTHRVRAVQGDWTELDVTSGGSTTVKLISAGTPTYTVEGAL